MCVERRGGGGGVIKRFPTERGTMVMFSQLISVITEALKFCFIF